MSDQSTAGAIREAGGNGTAITPRGVTALGQMDNGEFQARLGDMQRTQERLETIHRSLMRPNVDYGPIPGTGDKWSLLKPGAEKLCQFYGLVPEYRARTVQGDGEIAPAYLVETECRLRQINLESSELDGPIVATYIAVCNSHEKKYRYRKGDRACPTCGAVGAIIKGRAEYGGGWVCLTKKGGCGAKFRDGDRAIEGQVIGDVVNPDPYELANTILQISLKRALIGATRQATATSALYTQDVEDMDPADLGENGFSAPASVRTQTSSSRPVAGQGPAAPAVPVAVDGDALGAMTGRQLRDRFRVLCANVGDDAGALLRSGGLKSVSDRMEHIKAIIILEDHLRQALEDKGVEEVAFTPDPAPAGVDTETGETNGPPAVSDADVTDSRSPGESGSPASDDDLFEADPEALETLRTECAAIEARLWTDAKIRLAMTTSMRKNAHVPLKLDEMTAVQARLWLDALNRMESEATS